MSLIEPWIFLHLAHLKTSITAIPCNFWLNLAGIANNSVFSAEEAYSINQYNSVERYSYYILPPERAARAQTVTEVTTGLRVLM